MTESSLPEASREPSVPPMLTIPPLPTLNPRRLETISRDASPEFLVELAQIFTTDVEERIRCLAAVVATRDVTRTTEAAHGVQSAASSLGVMRLRSLAASLEKHAAREDWRRVELALARIQSEFLHVKDLLGALGTKR